MRLDKYLKVSRIIKRRTVANEACDQGRVSVNGKVAKASTAVAVGDVILSSGGGIYPYGFVIGTVVEIKHDETARSLSAIIEPAVDPQTTSRVMVLKKMTAPSEKDE